jgi:dipeptidyl aminopeptidase/acylaminoacyl peptidase
MLAFFERILSRTFVLRVVPTSGGEARELARFEQPVRQNQPRAHCIAWSPDNQYVYYCRSDASDVVETFRVAVAGGPSTSTGLKGPGAGDIEVSPDGTRIISRWGVPGERQLWAMDNFLPSGDSRRKLPTTNSQLPEARPQERLRVLLGSWRLGVGLLSKWRVRLAHDFNLRFLP